MILASIFIPLVILFNSFFIGKIYKRFNININIYTLLLYGFISFFGLIFCLIFPLFLFNVDVVFLFWYFLSIQFILLIIYALNWKWAFITYQINYQRILIFVIFLSIIIIIWILMHDFNNLSWVINVKTTNLNYLNKILNVSQKQTYFFIEPLQNYYQFPFITYFILFVAYAFNIVGNFDLQVFITVLYLFIIFITSCLVFCHLFYKYHLDYLNLLWYLIIFCSFSFFIFFWTKYSLISVLIFCLIGINFKNDQFTNNKNINILIINFLVFFGAGIDPNFSFLSLIINIGMIFLTYILKTKNSTTYNFLILFAPLVTFFCTFNNKHYLAIIFVIFVLLAYISFLVFKSTRFYQVMFQKIDSFLYKHIYYLLFFVIIVVFLVFFILFFNKPTFSIYAEPWIVNNNQLSIINDNPSLKNNVYLVINLVIWIMIAFLFIYSIIKIWKFNKDKFKNYIYYYIIIIIFLFFNPFFLDVINKFNNENFLSFQFNLFIIWFILINIVYFKINFLFERKYNFKNYLTIGIIFIQIITTLALNNL